MLGRLRDWLIVALLRIVLLISRPLPFDKRVVLGGKIVGAITARVPVASQRIFKNLNLIYPNNSSQENRQLVKAISRNFGMNLIEFYNMAEFAKRQKHVQPMGEGVRLLDELIAKNKPAIFVSGHFGNWEVFRAYMSGLGKPLASLYKENSNTHYERIFLKSLTYSGPAFTTGVRGMSGLIRHLRSGEMISLLHDQRIKGAPLMDFMGKPAHTSLATAEMALKYNIPIIPIYVTRLNGQSQFHIEIEAPIAVGSAEEMAQAMNDSLAKQVRKTADQWYWFHDRWHVRTPK